MLSSTIAMTDAKLVVMIFLCMVFVQVANLYYHFTMPFSIATKMCCFNLEIGRAHV